ncbi:MAG TPA: diphosphomevalonate decarboxylase [Kiritimatiellia bacterium]|nr:diphosphomevalonate decarboxylase [Kiritimatiellia bacterium]
MNKQDVVQSITGGQFEAAAANGTASAPANIALCKYWGKRNEEINLPVTSSLSVSLGHLGTTTTVEPVAGADEVILNGLPVPEDTTFARRLRAYLDLFRRDAKQGFKVITHNTIPTAAGLASSASGYAALALAMNELFGWDLDRRELSILARLGSGSASRSVYHGFVQWHAGSQDDGLDSFAELLPETWPDLRMGLVKISTMEKTVSSRDAMRETVAESVLYRSWPSQVERDLQIIRQAIAEQAFDTLGRAAENNALAMHATAIAAWPPTLFWWPESVKAMQKVWALRANGMPVYFTMDAGPNIKLLSDKQNVRAIQNEFPDVEWVAPFDESAR